MRAGRQTIVLVAAVTSVAVLIGPGVASAAAGVQAGGSAARAGPGSVLWSSMRAGEDHAVAADPRGGMVFVAGSSGLVAYDAATGAQLWANTTGAGRSVAVTPDGHTVFVIKPIHTTGTWDYFTAAFDAATGKQLWARHYNGRANGDDKPVALAVSPDGDTVFVTGTSKGKTSGRDYATVAYAAATGTQLWVSRYNGHAHGLDIPAAIAVSPRGGAVFVTGKSWGGATGFDFATIAYAAATSATVWTKRYDVANGFDEATAMAVSPDGRRVFVTGGSEGRTPGLDFATVAYAAATGAPLWVRRHGQGQPAVVLVSLRGGGTVLVAGQEGYLSVAYSAATGRTKWVTRFVEGEFQRETVTAAAISPDGRSFYLTGAGSFGPGGPAEGLTVAAKIATGALHWSQITGGIGESVAVSPDSSTVYTVLQANNGTTTTAFRA